MKTLLKKACIVVFLPTLLIFANDQEVLEEKLRTEKAEEIIEGTNDQNRASRLAIVSQILQGDYAERGLYSRLRMTSALKVLGEIDLNGTSAGLVKQGLDTPNMSEGVRGRAMDTYAKIINRTQCVTAAIATIGAYSNAPQLTIAENARVAIAETNQPEAVAHLDARLQADLNQLPPANFTITEENRATHELRFAFVFSGMKALRMMQLPAAQTKVQESMTALQTKYPNGPGHEIAQKFQTWLGL